MRNPPDILTPWLVIARKLAKELALSAHDREVRHERPFAEVQLLRETGLLTLVLEKASGGAGLNWQQAVQVIREISQGDTSVAMLLGYHSVNLFNRRLFPVLAAKRKELEELTIRHGWFWGNVSNPLDGFLSASPVDGGFLINGKKTFCTGAPVADVIFFAAKRTDNDDFISGYVPGSTEGIVRGQDWNPVGLRQADSSSISFDNVLVKERYLLTTARSTEPILPQATLPTPIIQLFFANLYLGAAWGAFQSASDYTRTESRAWISSGVEKASQDPYVLKAYGEFYIQLRAATALTNRAGQHLQVALDKGAALTKQERGEVTALVFAAKVATARLGLEIGTKLFDVTGARAASGGQGFDRFWRDVRTHSLHDPLAHKVKEIGDFALNGNAPEFAATAERSPRLHAGYWYT